MAHFAQINSNNIVEQVLVIDQETINTGLFGDPATWIQTSYNTRGGVHYLPNSNEPSPDQSKALRKNYACIGDTYDPVRDAFIAPKPFNSWLFNEETCQWYPPVPKPNDENAYAWNEEQQSWVVIEPFNK